MISHHVIGTGLFSDRLRADQSDPQRLLARVKQRVSDCGLEVVAEQAVPFTGGGLTLVWVLAESHLVLHLWPEEGSATLDLHVCDYRASNAGKTRRLRGELDGLCFRPGSGEWREMTVGGVAQAEFSGSHDPAGKGH